MLELHREWIARLADRIEPEKIARRRDAVRRMLAFEEVEELPYLTAPGVPKPGDDDWPKYEYNDAFDNPEKMLMGQLGMVWSGLPADDYRPANIRANYGTPILHSVLGGDWQLTDNSMPWAHHMEGGPDAIRELIARGPADPYNGLGGRCFETAEYYRQVLADFPPLDEVIDIYHPDLQGPYDIAHLLMGPDIFMAGYDEPELVEQLVDVVTRTYRAFIVEWDRRVGFDDGDGVTSHWSFFIPGRLMIRNDTAILLRGEQYEQFVRPFDTQLLEEFGGAIHFCGRGTQVLDAMTSTGGLGAIHSSQPELNDHARMLATCQEQKMPLLSWPEEMLTPGVTTGVLVGRRKPAN